MSDDLQNAILSIKAFLLGGVLKNMGCTESGVVEFFLQCRAMYQNAQSVFDFYFAFNLRYI